MRFRHQDPPTPNRDFDIKIIWRFADVSSSCGQIASCAIDDLDRPSIAGFIEIAIGPQAWRSPGVWRRTDLEGSQSANPCGVASKARLPTASQAQRLLANRGQSLSDRDLNGSSGGYRSARSSSCNHRRKQIAVSDEQLRRLNVF
jgi:hypothetical protein